jgi:DNA-binding transcriptional LysR family regulator
MAEQKRTGPDWEDIRVFLAVARHGSLSAAARALDVNHATIARRLKSLERAIGERLVDRRPDGYVLTGAGLRMLGPASDMETSAGILQRGARDSGLRGLVRINAPPSLTQAFLMKNLVPLSLEHPGLDIEITSDVRAVSLDRREADIAFRLNRPPDGDVIAQRLVSFGCAFYSNADWLSRISGGAEPVFVGFDEPNAHLSGATWLASHYPTARVSFRATNHLAQAVAVREGAGIALLPHFIANSDPLLFRCGSVVAPPEGAIWMLMRRQDRKELPIRIVSGHLRNMFEANRSMFEATNELT